MVGMFWSVFVALGSPMKQFIAFYLLRCSSFQTVLAAQLSYLNSCFVGPAVPALLHPKSRALQATSRGHKQRFCAAVLGDSWLWMASSGDVAGNSSSVSLLV